MHPTVRGTSVVLAVALAAAGCGGEEDPHGRLPLAGTVTFRGRPLDAGTVEFLPPDPARDLSARALVRDGRFHVPREQGLPPGTYRVLISSPEPGRAEGPAEAPGLGLPPPGRERIPPEYNRASRVTAEVRPGGDNRFDFTIE